MNGLPRCLAVVSATALLLGACGWFAGSRPSPAGSLSEAARSRGDREAPGVVPAEVSRPPVGQDSLDVFDRVVAVVNKDVITLSELLESVAQYFYERQQPVPKAPDQALMAGVLERLVETRLQLQEAEREKVVVEEAELEEQLAELVKRAGANSREELERVVTAQGLTIESVRKRLREQLMIQKVIRRKVAFRVSVTGDEIERYFQENRNKLETGLGFRARHILITPLPPGTEADWEAARLKAEEIWGAVRGGQDFAELARKFSQDPSASEGGDLGAMKQGELAPEIEAQILRLRPGEASRPFRSRLGYHIFKLEWRESLGGEALAQTKQQIRDILFRQQYQARSEAWLQELKRRAIIEIRL